MLGSSVQIARANVMEKLTLNQGAADDGILIFKSSDVAHGLTSIAETDTYVDMRKYAAAQGGLRIQALGENTVGHDVNASIDSYGGIADTTKSTAGNSLVQVYASQHDGANAQANIAADGNVWGVRCRRGGADVTVAIVDEDGDLWLNGATITLSGTQVVGARVVDSRIDDTVNSGDATTDGVIDAIRDAMIAHGLMAAT